MPESEAVVLMLLCDGEAFWHDWAKEANTPVLRGCPQGRATAFHGARF